MIKARGFIILSSELLQPGPSDEYAPRLAQRSHGEECSGCSLGINAGDNCGTAHSSLRAHRVTRNEKPPCDQQNTPVRPRGLGGAGNAELTDGGKRSEISKTWALCMRVHLKALSVLPLGPHGPPQSAQPPHAAHAVSVHRKRDGKRKLGETEGHGATEPLHGRPPRRQSYFFSPDASP